MQSVGVLLVFSYLVLPGVTGLLLGRRLRTVFGWSAITSIAGTLLGFTASVALDVPTGATIIVAMGVCAVAAWAWAAARPSAGETEAA